MPRKSEGQASTGTEAGGEAPRFDDLLDRLRKLVGRLESGNLSLEESLLSFEEGMQICRQGAVILESAEKRVEVLLARPGGKLETAPLDAGDNGDDIA